MKYIKCLLAGRSGEVRDVLIDTSGVLLGIFICIGIIKLWENIQEKKNNKNEII